MWSLASLDVDWTPDIWDRSASDLWGSVGKSWCVIFKLESCLFKLCPDGSCWVGKSVTSSSFSCAFMQDFDCPPQLLPLQQLGLLYLRGLLCRSLFSLMLLNEDKADLTRSFISLVGVVVVVLWHVVKRELTKMGLMWQKINNKRWYLYIYQPGNNSKGVPIPWIGLVWPITEAKSNWCKQSWTLFNFVTGMISPLKDDGVGCTCVINTHTDGGEQGFQAEYGPKRHTASIIEWGSSDSSTSVPSLNHLS